jgi:starvation-inducible DNA-binding protein
MARMNPTKNDLPLDLREKMVELLNDRLADAINLRLQAKQAHWNVKGPDFIQLHELFDQVYETSEAWVDDIAERAVQLGGIADGTVEGVSKRTDLAPYKLGTVAGRAHVESVSDGIARFGELIRKAAQRAEEAGDLDTSDLFVGVSRGADKMLWFVEAHLQND